MYQVLDWLDENAYRAYPLSEGAGIVVNNVVVEDVVLDANLVYYATIPSTVYLASIAVSGANLVFTITGQATFTVTAYLSAVYPMYLRNSTGSLLVVGSGAKKILSTYSTPHSLESSVSIALTGKWLGVSSLAFNAIPAVAGNIEFREGYQFKIDSTGKEITLGARRNYGIPIACETFFPSVVSDCEDIISYINSVTVSSNPDKFKFSAGSNIAIFEDPENNRIYIGLNFDGVDICPTPLSNPTI